jgi:benzylsuccinate CoA-transferase BbsF subunit
MTKSALEGIRVIDFGHVWAGPYCTATLADMGAEIIRVESKRHIDIHRRQGPYLNDKPGFNRSAVWNAQNRGKFGCTLNLAKPDGVELAKRLVAISDVAVENFAPRVMKKLGLDYPALREVKEDIILVSLPGFGSTGPAKDYISYGQSLLAASGIAATTGYPDSPPMSLGESYPDLVTALSAAFAILAALHHRTETGQGQHIDISQLEATMCLLPEALMEFSMNGTLRPRMGNQDDIMAPHGCYRCKGDDKWVAITVATDEEWEAFRYAIGDPDWAREERFADGFGRWSNQHDLDRLIEDWTKERTPYEVMEVLQKAGVAAGPSLNIEELINDPHIKECEVFVEVEHPEMGRQIVYRPTWRLSGTPGRIQRRAPLLGEHNHYVFGELLGMSDKEIARLEKEEIIY